MKKNVALVVGGSTGIGAATAKALAEEGYAVAITYLPSEKLQSAPGDLQLPLDVRKVSDIDNAISKVEESLGPIDVLVNSAGINVQQYALDVDEATWDSIQAINAKGLFFVCQAVAKRMVARGKGNYAIVNISSQMGLVGYERRAAYCASKAAVVNLTKVFAIEWAQHGIRVNAVAPTFIETPLTAPMFEEAGFRKEIESRSPMGRVGKPSEVAEVIKFLCSDGASLMTGATLPIDGGWTAW
jgi:NAD(P)-dependent dehydrogenase (short-subunit alcohol dehydrogenase family)